MPPTALSHPSPKRKREQPPPIPLLNTALRPATAPPTTTAATPPRARTPTPDSPRDAVANQFRGMSLAQAGAPIPMSPLTPTDDVVRKKPKLEEGPFAALSLEDRLRNDNTALAGTPQGEKGQSAAVGAGPALDTTVILESPEAQMRPRFFSGMVSFAQQPTAFVSATPDSSPVKPSPLQTHLQGPSQPRSRSQTRSPQPRPRNKSPSPPPPAALTWQDSEITGHLADPKTDPDDDGTGLNGIGFRPTPAIAWARAQRRKQQLSDWKAREAREARAKRSERRRRGVGGYSSREATVERELVLPVKIAAARRTVKFAV